MDPPRQVAGFTGRANPARGRDPGLPVGAAATRIIVYATRHGIAPMAMVVTGSAEEQALRALGWVDTYVPTQVLVARLADLLGERPAPEDVRVGESLTDAWLAAYGRSRQLPADSAVVRRILDNHPPRTFAAMAGDGALVAIGRGHVSGPWLGVAAVWVDRAPGWWQGNVDHDGTGTLGAPRLALRYVLWTRRTRGAHSRKKFIGSHPPGYLI